MTEVVAERVSFTSISWLMLDAYRTADGPSQPVPIRHTAGG